MVWVYTCVRTLKKDFYANYLTSFTFFYIFVHFLCLSCFGIALQDLNGSCIQHKIISASEAHQSLGYK